MTNAEKAVLHLINRIRKDGRLAYIICPLSESYGLLTEAYADIKGIDVNDFRRDYEKTLAPKAWPKE
jgi:hypothetical protein